jgi:gas vesicle protein
MVNENQGPKYHNNNILGVLTGLVIGGLAGAAAMLLLAPQSGEETRTQIRKKGLELRDRTTGMIEDTMTQVRSNVDRITIDGREKLKELKQQGQELAAEQLGRVSKAAQAGKKAIENSKGG